MAKTQSSYDADQLAAHLRESQEKLAGGTEGATQQVMSGFAEAYRAWLEAVSAKPETMLDLQGRYMQEQMRLWMESMRLLRARERDPLDPRDPRHRLGEHDLRGGRGPDPRPAQAHRDS